MHYRQRHQRSLAVAVDCQHVAAHGDQPAQLLQLYACIRACMLSHTPVVIYTGSSPGDQEQQLQAGRETTEGRDCAMASAG